MLNEKIASIENKQNRVKHLTRKLNESLAIRKAYDLSNEGKLSVQRIASANRDFVKISIDGLTLLNDSLKEFERKTGVFINWRIKN